LSCRLVQSIEFPSGHEVRTWEIGRSLKFTETPLVRHDPRGDWICTRQAHVLAYVVYGRYRHIGPERADAVDAQPYGGFDNTKLAAGVAVDMVMGIRMASIVGMRINRDHVKAAGNSFPDARHLRWSRPKNH
jgi:hypothetical protein